jgi:hypothetical protein
VSLDWREPSVDMGGNAMMALVEELNLTQHFRQRRKADAGISTHRVRTMGPRRIGIEYINYVGYPAISLVILTFMWFFGDFLLRTPETYPLWDQRLYYSLARVARALLSGESNSWAPFRATLGRDYNALFGLPLAPALMAFGESYYVYGMAVAVIYGTAASLAVGAIPVAILAGYRPSVIFPTSVAAAFVTATSSSVWFAVIWYYPDVGDALVLALWIIGAILLLRRPTWLRTGALVVLTVAVLLFRRHLLFPWSALGIGLATSAAIECWVDWRTSDPRERRMRLHVGALRIGTLAASAIIALGIISILIPSFVRSMVSAALYNAYSDYERSPTEVVLAMLGVIGIIPAVLSVAGYVAGVIVFRSRRLEIVGLGLGAVGNIVLWVFVLRQAGPQYWIVPGALFLPIGIGLGIGALAEKLRGRTLTAALGTAFLLLLLSAGRLVDGAASGAMEPPLEVICEPCQPITSSLLQGRVTKPSLHRGMEGPLKEVFARMEVEGPQPRTIFVVASSGAFNEALLRSAAEALLGHLAKSYLFHWVPASDARDRLPVSEIMDADFVLIADPLQTQFRPTGSKGLASVWDMFSDHSRAALDFDRMGEPVAFPGFSVSIYKRVRESDDPVALATIEALRSAVPHRGYGQPSWIEIGRPRRGEPVDATGNRVVAHNRIEGDGWPARYLSYDGMPLGLVELRGVGGTSCPRGTLLTLRVVTPDGARHEALATTFIAQSVVQQPFSLAAAVPVLGSHLELKINPPLDEVPCDVALERLQVQSGKSVP